MKLLQINSSDFLGSRFNGYAIQDRLQQRGLDTHYLVWRRYSDDPSVELAYNFPYSRHMTALLNRVEGLLSLQSRLHLQWLTLPLDRRFRSADVVHYHVIHDGYFSLSALPLLSRKKPTVWTFHDPWPMTGHCLYPIDCTHWQFGCGNCPDLKLPFPLRRDRTHQNWKHKEAIYAKVDADVIVASRWMKDLAEQSPLTRGFRVHLVPFGLDLDRFRPRPPDQARERLGVFPGHTVIGHRAVENPYKGLEQLKQALRRLKTDRPICIVTTQSKGVFDEFIGRYQIVELGWTNDENLLIESYQAIDFYVMPSLAEAFGLMAAEAMACGKPVVCFEGTSLPEVTFAPDAGVAVPRNADALAAAIDHLVESPDEVRLRGERARQLTEANYGIDLYLDRLIGIYQAAIERRRSKAVA